MTSQLLLDSLELYLKHNPDKAEEVTQAIGEIKELQIRYAVIDARETWHDEVCITTMSDVCEQTNQQLYDLYGDLYVANDKQPVSFEVFNEAVHRDAIHEAGFEHYTNNMLESGWQVIYCLYNDNEAEGNHSADGHYNG